jgi:hypothetical protein
MRKYGAKSQSTDRDPGHFSGEKIRDFSRDLYCLFKINNLRSINRFHRFSRSTAGFA